MSNRRPVNAATNRPSAEELAEIANIVLEAADTAGPVDTWRMPWHGISGMPENPVTGRPFSKTNFIKLISATRIHGFKSYYFASDRAWASRRGRLTRFDRGIKIWKPEIEEVPGPWNPIGPIGGDPLGGPRVEIKDWDIATVFNGDDVEGAQVPTPGRPEPFEAIGNAEELVEAYRGARGPAIVHAGSRACYDPTHDRVQMPKREAFASYGGLTSAQFYYAIKIHEIAHSTGSPHRLARPGLLSPDGSNEYAKEELIADIASAMVGARIGLATQLLQDHARYVKSWLRAIKDKPQALAWACAEAQKAALFILQSQERLAQLAAAKT